MEAQRPSKDSSAQDPPAPSPVAFAEAARFWAKLGFISFGGPTGQIAILHEEVVERRRWVSEDRFLHALNFCMLLPGPEAQQLVTAVGWMLHGTRGAIVAGTLFILPSILILLVLSWVYVRFGSVEAVSAVFAGLRPAVVAIVAAALVRIARRTLRHPVLVAIALVALFALTASPGSFPFVLAGAAVIGFIGARRNFAAFRAPARHGPASGTGASAPSRAPRDTFARFLRRLAVFLLLWIVPLGGLVAWRGRADVFVEEALFFTKAAMVTFGGAYAVLPYVAHRAVEDHGWLTTTQMIDGLGLAETTPGPLIMVLQFVGYLAGAGGAPELGTAGAVVGALVATYFTFLPSFAWILLAVPSIERLQGHSAISGALAAVTAAVVGVIASLAIWFGAQVLFPNGAGGRTVDVPGLVILALSLLALERGRWSIPAVVFAAAAISWAANQLGG